MEIFEANSILELPRDEVGIAMLSDGQASPRCRQPPKSSRTTITGGQPLLWAGLLIALIVGTLVICRGHEPLKIYSHVQASLGDPDAWAKTVNRAVPLGLAGWCAVAGSMGLWNIGAEGQIMAGAIAAAWVARIGGDWPGIILISMMLIAAIGAVGF